MTPPSYNRNPLANVSRETANRLVRLQELVGKWTKTINLVSKASLDNLFTRHILDSAQIFDLAPSNAQLWADLGSGGGFPGLVIACIAAEKNPQLRVILVESDQRKATFLRLASQHIGIDVDVRDERIERTAALGADVVSARALAPLSLLCEYAHRHLAPTGTALLHKGAHHIAEVELARQHWQFDLAQVDSVTEPSAVILKIKGLVHA